MVSKKLLLGCACSLLLNLPLHAWPFFGSLSMPSKDKLHSFELKIKEEEPQITQLFPDVVARVGEFAQDERKVIKKAFDLGEFNIVPFSPISNSQGSRRSVANLILNLPKSYSGLELQGGICYNFSESPKNGIGHQEQVVYLVSTKTLEESKWRPFISLSYLRSQVRGTPRAFHNGLQEVIHRSSANYAGSKRLYFSDLYTNVEVLETCCGLQPFENLSLILSFNYLKPLNKKGLRLNASSTKLFDVIKKQSQGVDLKVDYRVREGLNLLVKSECLLTNGSLREKADKPVVIEGSLIVSF